MMKMKFSKNAGILGGLLPLMIMVFVFVFSGVKATAQSVSPYSVDVMYKQYGNDFYDTDQSAKLVKQAYALTLALEANDPVSEATKSLDMHYASTFIHNIGEGKSVKSALDASYSAASVKSKDFVLNVDVSAIHAKYYDLLTK